MARFTLPRDLYHGKGSLETLKTLKGKRAIIVVGGGSMKKFGFLDRVEQYLKEAGFEVMDKIRVYARDNRKIEEILAEHGEEIRSEVLAEEIILDKTQGYEKEWNINSEKVMMAVEKL